MKQTTARIGHVVDARDTRQAFRIEYRRYSDTSPSSVRIQAADVDQALQALRAHVGSDQYAVTSINGVRQSGSPAPARTGMHVRTENGVRTLVTTRAALDEMNAAMMDKAVKRTVREMSASRDSADITYRDGRKGRKVSLRPASAQDVADLTPAPEPEPEPESAVEAVPAAPEWRTLKGLRVGDTVRLWAGNRKTGPTGEGREATLVEIRTGWVFRYTDTGWTGWIGGAASKHWVTV